jgi:hypothetical protein
MVLVPVRTDVSPSWHLILENAEPACICGPHYSLCGTTGVSKPTLCASVFLMLGSG